MARFPVPPPRGQPWARPWVILAAGFGAVLVGLILSAFPGSLDALRFLLVLAGLCAAGAAVAARLRQGPTEVADRTDAALLVAGAAFTSLAAYLALDEAWDSGKMVFGVLTVVAFAGSVLVLLPSRGRRLVASLLIVFHFGGILTAINRVDPQGAPAPWLAMQLWGHVYRPYLGFFYLENAYHFYSPNPGPTTMIWFRVEFDRAPPRWVKMPVRGNSPLPLHFQRRIALGMSLEAFMPPVSEQLFQLPPDQLPTDVRDNVRAVRVVRRLRLEQGFLDHIPPHPSMTLAQQYVEPTPYAQTLTASYARYIALTETSPDDPEAKVTRVKVYRVVQTIPDPAVVAARGLKAYDKTINAPVYQGEFGWFDNDKGEKVFGILDGHEWRENDRGERDFFPGDPYLYWLLPIIPARSKEEDLLDGTEDGILDCCELHGTIRREPPRPWWAPAGWKWPRN
jgi:hypothetical protein